MNVKKIIGLLLMAVAVVVFLLLTNAIIFIYLDPELKHWITSSGIGFLLIYGLTFLLFRLGRKWFRNKEEEIRTDILDTTDILEAAEFPIAKSIFRMKPDGFEEIKSKMIKQSLPLGILATVIGLGIGLYQTSYSGEIDWKFFLFIIPMILLILSYSFKRGIDRQRQTLESYVLSFNETSISRKAHNMPDIIMAHADIKSISKNKDGGFFIKSASSKDIIWVITQIERKEELEELLNEIHPITTDAPKSFIEKYRILLGILPLGLMAVIFLSTNKWMVGIAGVLFLMAMGYSLFEIQGNKNIDDKTRRSSWLILLVVVSVVGAMYQKIFVM